MPCSPGTEQRALTPVRRQRASHVEDERAATRLVSRAVRLAQQGDRDALAFLYARYADDIYAYVRSIDHDHHEAEDLSQHEFAKLMSVIGAYQERDVPFLAWMLLPARNVAIDHIRQQRLIPVQEIRTAEPNDGDLRLAGPADDQNGA